MSQPCTCYSRGSWVGCPVHDAQPSVDVLVWVARFDATPATNIDWPARFAAAAEAAKDWPSTAGCLRSLALQLQSLSTAFPDVAEAVGCALLGEDPS